MDKIPLKDSESLLWMIQIAITKIGIVFHKLILIH
jgi:hypothetical protein